MDKILKYENLDYLYEYFNILDIWRGKTYLVLLNGIHFKCELIKFF